MSTGRIKASLHDIVDQINNEKLLHTVYEFLLVHKNNKDGALWENLTQDQRNEVFLAYEESENLENLVPNKDVLK